MAIRCRQVDGAETVQLPSERSLRMESGRRPTATVSRTTSQRHNSRRCATASAPAGHGGRPVALRRCRHVASVMRPYLEAVIRRVTWISAGYGDKSTIGALDNP